MRVINRRVRNGKRFLFSQMTTENDFTVRKDSRDTAILVLEASSTARESLSELFREQGYDVHKASNSVDANQCLDGNRILHVILIDLDMPDWESIIKQGRQNPGSPLIFCMIGFRSTSNDLQHAKQLGAHGHFVKPLNFVNVNRSIQNSLTR